MVGDKSLLELQLETRFVLSSRYSSHAGNAESSHLCLNVAGIPVHRNAWQSRRTIVHVGVDNLRPILDHHGCTSENSRISEAAPPLRSKPLSVALTENVSS